MTVTAQLDQLCINTLRFLSVDMVQKAESRHPGLPLGAAPMAYVLWTRWLKFNPHNPHWFNRDSLQAAIEAASIGYVHVAGVRDARCMYSRTVIGDAKMFPSSISPTTRRPRNLRKIRLISSNV